METLIRNRYGQDERLQSSRQQRVGWDLEEEQKARERLPVDHVCGLPLTPVEL